MHWFVLAVGLRLAELSLTALRVSAAADPCHAEFEVP
jgi:hypothetical protein